ncbi:MAG: citramalate synthase [Clostridiales bacterium]|nr:citramalate synthase [Clostridiales bacterium]
MKRIEIFDSMLRDGAQGEGVAFSVIDKLNIVKALDAFGVDYIEAGNPGSNPKDIEFFEQAQHLKLKHAKLCAFGSTCRKGRKPEEDFNVRSLMDAKTDVIVIFGKAWDLHVLKVLNTTLKENLRMVKDTVAFLKAAGKEVIFDAEHFFDGYKENAEFAMQVLKAADEAGADSLCLCDTNGGTAPERIGEIVREVSGAFPNRRIGIHCHNDIGCAVASSMSAVAAGAVQVQGTFIGIGERCGNADLSTIIPNLRLKMGYECGGDLVMLRDTAAKLSELCNMRLRRNEPYVGDSAFAHKGGMHIDGVSKVSRSFEHVAPETVGNVRRFLMSEVSGRTTVLAKIVTIAPGLKKDSPEVTRIVEKTKEMEHEGYQFESADASFELMALKILGCFHQHFKLGMYRISGEFPHPDGSKSASAMLSVQVGDVQETTAAMGNGPVHALDTALRKALTVFYPQLSNVRLVDYKVRVLTGKAATASRVRVLIESSDGEMDWTTTGVNTDIIAASWEALTDSIEYYLHQKEGTAKCP